MLMFSFAVTLSAQTKTSATKSTIPKLRVSLGGYPGGEITSDIMKSIVDSSIVVRDEKGNRYPVTHFRVNYFFRSSYKDEQTEQVKSVQDFRAFDFYDTPMLSENWRESIKDNVKKDDEMLLDNITVRMKNGKKLLAPELKLKVIQ
jgi:hypothetical protein